MKKIISVLLAFALLTVLFAGCGSEGNKGGKPDNSGAINLKLPDKDYEDSEKNDEKLPEETPDSSSGSEMIREPDNEASPDPEVLLRQINAEAEEAFAAFLRGERSVITSQAYLQPDESGYFYNIPEGEYDYGALKEAVAELEYGEFSVSYAFTDLGNDGKTDMVIRLDNYEPSLLNWTGTFCYEDGNIYLSSNWHDGYRSFSDLYTTGYLLYGGSGGAGLFISDLSEFNAGAELVSVYKSSRYFSSFAAQIFWDLLSAGNITEDQRSEYSSMFDDLCMSEICLTECFKNNKFYISCIGRNESDEEVFALEQKLLDLLSECGCEIVSEEDMNLLLSFETDEDKLVEFTLWEFDEAKSVNPAG
ncbi:MAG: hypothetical protein MJ067_04685 [Oscillospiraceae bacterium]|nr:hypothetical protein [Oscillospiraceae bacterium]